jgi:hypothetical protein
MLSASIMALEIHIGRATKEIFSPRMCSLKMAPQVHISVNCDPVTQAKIQGKKGKSWSRQLLLDSP